MGGSRPGNPLLSGESDPVAESCGAGKGGQALGRRRRRKGLRPSSRGGRARRAAAEYQPGYDGLPGGGGRRAQPCESRGEWRGHSGGRRVVAASVPTASAPVPSALATEYQPGYDGLPDGAQGLRALRIASC